MSKSKSSEKPCLNIGDGLPWGITPKADLCTPPVHTHILTFIHINTHEEVLHSTERQIKLKYEKVRDENWYKMKLSS